MRLPRPHLRFTSVCSLSRQLGVGEATTHGLQHRQREAVFIGERVVLRGAIIEPENLLTQVAVKVEWLNCNVCAAKSALQETPEVLNPLSVYVAVHILMRVIDDLMNELSAQAVILHRFIGVDLSKRGHIVENRILQCVSPDVGENLCANLTKLAIQDSVDSSLTYESTLLSVTRLYLRLAALVHLVRVRSNVRFVGLYGATKAKLMRRVRLHCFPNPMKHEPSGFLSHANGPMQFVAADSVLAIADHPDRRHPLVQTDRGILKDRADLDGELFLASLAEPNLAGAHKRIGVRATARARNFVIRPAHPLGILECAIRVTEVNNCLLEGYGLFHLSTFRSIGRILLTFLCVKYIIAEVSN